MLSVGNSATFPDLIADLTKQLLILRRLVTSCLTMSECLICKFVLQPVAHHGVIRDNVSGEFFFGAF